MFETVLVSSNDELVKLYLNKKIKFSDIVNKLNKILNLNEFKKYKKILPSKISEVISLNKYVRFKIKSSIN